MSPPGYWMYETGPSLRPAIKAYLNREPLTKEQIAVIRAYFRQWVDAFHGKSIEQLRAKIDGLVDDKSISQWLGDAIDIGIDPL